MARSRTPGRRDSLEDQQESDHESDVSRGQPLPAHSDAKALHATTKLQEELRDYAERCNEAWAQLCRDLDTCRRASPVRLSAEDIWGVWKDRKPRLSDVSREELRAIKDHELPNSFRGRPLPPLANAKEATLALRLRLQERLLDYHTRRQLAWVEFCEDVDHYIRRSPLLLPEQAIWDLWHAREPRPPKFTRKELSVSGPEWINAMQSLARDVASGKGIEAEAA